MHETLYSKFFVMLIGYNERQCYHELGFSKWEVSCCCELVGEKSNLLVVDLVFKVMIQEIIICNKNGIYIAFALDRPLNNRSILKENAWNVRDWNS